MIDWAAGVLARYESPSGSACDLYIHTAYSVYSLNDMYMARLASYSTVYAWGALRRPLRGHGFAFGDPMLLLLLTVGVLFLGRARGLRAGRTYMYVRVTAGVERRTHET